MLEEDGQVGFGYVAEEDIVCHRSSQLRFLWPIRCLAVNGSNKLRQVSVAQLLPDREILSDVIPIMVYHTLKKVSTGGGNLPAIADHVFLQSGRSQGVEPGVSSGCDRLPRQMPDVPTDAIHRQDALARVVIRNSLDCAQEFTACKTQLAYKRVVHGDMILSRDVLC